MTGARRGAPPASHAPRAVDAAVGLPAVLLRELLRAQPRGHRRGLRFPTRPARAADRAHGERGGVIGIVDDIGIGGAQRARGLRVLPDERDRAIHAAARTRADIPRRLQQRVQHERRERLAGAQEAVGSAMPAAIGLLLPPEPVRGPGEGWPRSARASGKPGQRGEQNQRAHQRLVEVVRTTVAGAGSRSAVSSSTAALVTATRPVMQWCPAHVPSSFWSLSSLAFISPFHFCHSAPPVRCRLSLMLRYEKNSSPPIEPKPLTKLASASCPVISRICLALFLVSSSRRLGCWSSWAFL